MMESSELFSSLTIDDVFMVVLTAITVVLTGIIAWSVRSQAKYTKQLADDTKQLTDISIQAEKRAREQNKPKVKFTSHSYDIGTDGTRKSFVGFSITNASPFDVTITSFSLRRGIPLDRLRGRFPQTIEFRRIDQYRGSAVSDFSLPQRLQCGESMRVLYDEDDAIATLRREGNGQPVRFRPQCHDSLGNTHNMEYWVVWEKDSLAGFPDPGSGLIPEEQWAEEWAKLRHREREEQLAKSRPVGNSRALRSVCARLFRRHRCNARSSFP